MNIKNTRRGFTLIELLVVVLIIGILAAVAVPQYTYAVNKSRVVQAITTLKALSDAQEIYYLSSGEYTNDLEALNISIETQVSNLWKFSCKDKRFCMAEASNRNIPNLEVDLRHVPANAATWIKLLAGKFYCVSMNKAEQAKKICASLGKEDNTLANFNSNAYGHYFLLN